MGAVRGAGAGVAAAPGARPPAPGAGGAAEPPAGTPPQGVDITLLVVATILIVLIEVAVAARIWIEQRGGWPW